MKKLLLLPVATLLLFACSPKASKSTAGTTTSTQTTVSGPTVAPPSATNGPGEEQLTAAKTKFPDVTLDVLKKGHGLYYGVCTNCHGAKNIVKRDEKEWVSIIDEMAPKAKLSAEEKDAVWKYVMSVKLAAK